MNGKQHAVMWLGLLLIVLRLFTSVQWTELKAVFQTGQSSTGSTGNQTGLQNPLTPGGLLHDLNPLATGFNPFHAVIIGGQTFFRDIRTGKLFPASGHPGHPPVSIAHQGR